MPAFLLAQSIRPIANRQSNRIFYASHALDFLVFTALVGFFFGDGFGNFK